MTNDIPIKDAINLLEIAKKHSKEKLMFCFNERGQRILDMAIKALKQEDVLDKIRAEILDEAEYAYADFDRYKEDILYAEADELPDDDFRYGMERAVEIIDKCKAESEDEG